MDTHDFFKFLSLAIFLIMLCLVFLSPVLLVGVR